MNLLRSLQAGHTAHFRGATMSARAKRGQAPSSQQGFTQGVEWDQNYTLARTHISEPEHKASCRVNKENRQRVRAREHKQNSAKLLFAFHISQPHGRVGTLTNRVQGKSRWSGGMAWNIRTSLFPSTVCVFCNMKASKLIYSTGYPW